jgi:putative DNA primase/helicase
LSAIARWCGDEWTLKARAAAVALSGAEDDDEPGILLLTDLRRMFEQQQAVRGTDLLLAKPAASVNLASKDIIAELKEMEDRPWPEWKRGVPISERGVAKLLKPFGVEPRQVRIGGSDRVKGYSLKQFTHVFRRYLPPPKV